MAGELTPTEWALVHNTLDAGNENYTGAEIVRHLANRGFKIVKLREDDHEYLASLLRHGEKFR